MLSPADAALVRRDPDVPGLAVLLDDEALRVRVGSPVVRRYLRYKPGTSCILGATAELDGAPVDVFFAAHDGESAVKLEKTSEQAPPGAVLLHDPALGLSGATSAGDRDLPLLALLADPKRRRRVLRRLLPEHPDLHAAPLSTLSYKPMRRWVGLLQPTSGPSVVLRAYRPQDAERSAAAAIELGHGAPRTPALLAADISLGVLAVQYLPGRTLDRLLLHAPSPDVAAAGRALAALHERALAGLPSRTPQDAADGVRAAARQVGVLLPELDAAATRLAHELTGRLDALPGADPVTVHGDFSADQVVVGTDGELVLLDLDRAALGDAAEDLASLFAARVAAEVLQDAAGGPSARALLRTLSEGYAESRALPVPEAVAVHAAAHLLRRVADPFRTCAPQWPARTAALLEAALAVGERGVDAPLRVAVPRAHPDPLQASPIDLLAPLLGPDVRIEILKDKPGRRCTSRATGAAGSAIVKVYASERAPVVAARVAAVAHDGAEPVLPRVLLCDEQRHVVVLSDVPGAPYREALLAGDVGASRRVGRALARWHAAHRGRVPRVLRAHTVERELRTLRERAETAPPGITAAVREALPALSEVWECDTVVHRDLYEEQVVLGDHVGLYDLDDAAAGPAELDLGNLLAHLNLLSRRAGVGLDEQVAVLLTSYVEVAPLDPRLLRRCESLSRLRLACLHQEAALLEPADERILTGEARAWRAGGEG